MLLVRGFSLESKLPEEAGFWVRVFTEIFLEVIWLLGLGRRDIFEEVFLGRQAMGERLGIFE